MITFKGINISTVKPLELVDFYKKYLGLSVLEESDNGDGTILGNMLDEPVIWIWDETKWEQSNGGFVTFVFTVENVDNFYKELINKGLEIDPPIIAVWGGKELKVKDPEGNVCLILE